MKPLLVLLVLLSCGLARAESAPNTLSEAEKRSGWRLLFDGSSADGFRNYRQDKLGPGWVIEDGALVRKGNGAGDVVTKDEFGNFELQLEYRISPGGNSGVMFHVLETEPAPWMTGPEVQILDNTVTAEGQKAGWLYGLYPAWPARWPAKRADGTRPQVDPNDASRPAGQWNHLYLRVKPGAGEVCLNGVRYFTFDKNGKDWLARVAKSKFAQMPGFGKADRGRICLQDHGDEVAFRSIKVRELPAEGPVPQPIDGTLEVKVEPAFPGIEWEGWSAETTDGTPAVPLRPLTIVPPGDGSDRLFVADQSGMIHVVRPGAAQAKLFIDLRETTARWQKENEEGLLGLAFHPRFKENGEFFVCYCVRGEKREQRISRFRVSKQDPDRADPASEEVVLSFDQPYANHNGGSIAFGLDGMLYLGLGDGGLRDDPLGSGQKLDTLLGKIVRIDIDRKDAGLGYAIPADNPFVGRADARPEIFAYGFRNPWTISVDRQTGQVWAADVGQDLWEEVNVVQKGGNYGWSVREGTMPFGRTLSAAATTAPVWEYDHQIGKSVTGGLVYRGKRIPALVGSYLYGDHVSGRLWALRIDDMGKVVNMAIPWNGLPVFGFGQDAEGEVFVTTSSPIGQGVYRIVP